MQTCLWAKCQTPHDSFGKKQRIGELSTFYKSNKEITLTLSLNLLDEQTETSFVKANHVF